MISQTIDPQRSNWPKATAHLSNPNQLSNQKQPPKEKWTAFWLSLLLPGTGQLFAGSWTAIPWFLAYLALGGITHAAVILAGNNLHEMGYLFKIARSIPFILLGIASAEHAKRYLEPGSKSRDIETPEIQGNETQKEDGCAKTSRIESYRIGKRAVQARFDLVVHQSRAELWSQIADLPRFLTIDPFHTQITLGRKKIAPGVDLVLHHNAFGLKFLRFGRIIKWNEGTEFAFGDLSGKSPSSGFPHVFYFRLLPVEENSWGENFAGKNPWKESSKQTRLVVEIKGKWTAPWIPAWLGIHWIRYVHREHARLLKQHFQSKGIPVTQTQSVTGARSVT